MLVFQGYQDWHTGAAYLENHFHLVNRCDSYRDVYMLSMLQIIKQRPMECPWGAVLYRFHPVQY